MTPSETDETLRPLMFSIAYRMLGSVSEAEDVVQDAYLRLEQARRGGTRVESPKAYLSAITTRIAIDQLRSARRKRESYVGPWLPEPLLVDEAPGPAEHAELTDSLSQAVLVVLESLTPVERAVFLLREVFGHDYEEIAGVVGKSEDNTRQLAARARRHVEARRPRFESDRRQREELLDRFLAASESGDTDALKELLADDVVMYADGGGRATAARRPLFGAARVARVITKIAQKRLRRGGLLERRVSVNGQPGRVLARRDGVIVDVLAIDVADGRVQAIRIVRNPDKLAHLEPLAAGN